MTDEQENKQTLLLAAFLGVHFFFRVTALWWGSGENKHCVSK